MNPTLEMQSKSTSTNPFLRLNYEPAMESLGEDYADVVAAAQFPLHLLRWRNDRVLTQIGLDPAQVSDDDFIEAFGHFQAVRPFLALRYHGYQFGEYNPQLGDGRGFLYGQVRGIDGELYDFGTKGSGRTPYSRTADGRLTLKGGVREVLASEALYRMGVRTSRCLSMIETGEDLWRGDEPSPTRSSVMVRFSRSHIRFGTFERLHWHGRADLVRKLLDHTIAVYYPHLWGKESQDALFYAELVQRVARLVAQWMAAGFCHAVLNTDNMSITGESFDYGPYAFIPTYDPAFTAAYFDYSRRYCYSNQPAICYWNLEMLQTPLKLAMSGADLTAGLEQFKEHYRSAYCEIMLHRLGLETLSVPEAEEIITLTLQFLAETQMGYNDFFIKLRQEFHANWREDVKNIWSQDSLKPKDGNTLAEPQIKILDNWRSLYHQFLIRLPIEEMEAIAQRLIQSNPLKILLRPEIQAIWEPITLEDNWQPFYDLIEQIQAS
ncbi:YdiU family protein [Tumidithrix elongata RA019]|uniref:Protein nucleotidyltransferase YdiU n=1 Tax=Tumidithrix elongata BACA0141 TaxID=2716417 RepID=A0AAW9PVI4_9CYAN|nr:YdiU family protein [Tumidithrix elongata RA019]